ncbi:hypothetical protein ACQEVS_08065 [Streptomyces sp. CA-181903]|uniref:hypothetical protein n=1 Tax=Streptomyces sp. CA-181903 TaxID=3240055 RepID=UPI003D91B7DB
MSERLGPIERVGGRWIVGDTEWGKRPHLEFGAEGVLWHEPGKGGPEPVPSVPPVPWGRFMSLHLAATHTRLESSTTLAVLSGGAFLGRRRCSLQGTLRHPYEPWTACYGHHARRYGTSELLLAQFLVSLAFKAGPARRLGDPRWMAEAVGRLAPLRVRKLSVARAAVAEVVRDLGGPAE